MQTVQTPTFSSGSKLPRLQGTRRSTTAPRDEGKVPYSLHISNPSPTTDFLNFDTAHDLSLDTSSMSTSAILQPYFERSEEKEEKREHSRDRVVSLTLKATSNTNGAAMQKRNPLGIPSQHAVVADVLDALVLNNGAIMAHPSLEFSSSHEEEFQSKTKNEPFSNDTAKTLLSETPPRSILRQPGSDTGKRKSRHIIFALEKHEYTQETRDGSDESDYDFSEPSMNYTDMGETTEKHEHQKPPLERSAGSQPNGRNFAQEVTPIDTLLATIIPKEDSSSEESLIDQVLGGIDAGEGKNSNELYQSNLDFSSKFSSSSNPNEGSRQENISVKLKNAASVDASEPYSDSSSMSNNSSVSEKAFSQEPDTFSAQPTPSQIGRPFYQDVYEQAGPQHASLDSNAHHSELHGVVSDATPEMKPSYSGSTIIDSSIRMNVKSKKLKRLSSTRDKTHSPVQIPYEATIMPSLALEEPRAESDTGNMSYSNERPISPNEDLPMLRKFSPSNPERTSATAQPILTKKQKKTSKLARSAVEVSVLDTSLANKQQKEIGHSDIVPSSACTRVYTPLYDLHGGTVVQKRSNATQRCLQEDDVAIQKSVPIDHNDEGPDANTHFDHRCCMQSRSSSLPRTSASHRRKKVRKKAVVFTIRKRKHSHQEENVCMLKMSTLAMKDKGAMQRADEMETFKKAFDHFLSSFSSNAQSEYLQHRFTDVPECSGEKENIVQKNVESVNESGSHAPEAASRPSTTRMSKTEEDNAEPNFVTSPRNALDTGQAHVRVRRLPELKQKNEKVTVGEEDLASVLGSFRVDLEPSITPSSSETFRGNPHTSALEKESASTRQLKEELAVGSFDESENIMRTSTLESSNKKPGQTQAITGSVDTKMPIWIAKPVIHLVHSPTGEVFTTDTSMPLLLSPFQINSDALEKERLSAEGERRHISYKPARNFTEGDASYDSRLFLKQGPKEMVRKGVFRQRSTIFMPDKIDDNKGSRKGREENTDYSVTLPSHNRLFQMKRFEENFIASDESEAMNVNEPAIGSRRSKTRQTSSKRLPDKTLNLGDSREVTEAQSTEAFLHLPLSESEEHPFFALAHGITDKGGTKRHRHHHYHYHSRHTHCHHRSHTNPEHKIDPNRTKAGELQSLDQNRSSGDKKIGNPPSEGWNDVDGLATSLEYHLGIIMERKRKKQERRLRREHKRKQVPKVFPEHEQKANTAVSHTPAMALLETKNDVQNTTNATEGWFNSTGVVSDGVYLNESKQTHSHLNKSRNLVPGKVEVPSEMDQGWQNVTHLHVFTSIKRDPEEAPSSALSTSWKNYKQAATGTWGAKDFLEDHHNSTYPHGSQHSPQKARHYDKNEKKTSDNTRRMISPSPSSYFSRDKAQNVGRPSVYLDSADETSSEVHDDTKSSEIGSFRRKGLVDTPPRRNHLHAILTDRNRFDNQTPNVEGAGKRKGLSARHLSPPVGEKNQPGVDVTPLISEYVIKDRCAAREFVYAMGNVVDGLNTYKLNRVDYKYDC